MNSTLLAVPASDRSARIRFGIAAALLAVVAPAQVWQQVQPAVHPGDRSGHCLVYDAARGVTLLVGGRPWNWQVPDFTNWAWDGTTWSLMQTIVAPPPRWDAAMAYDSGRQRVVLFGGVTPSGTSQAIVLDDTWEWDGVGWLERVPLQSPPGTFRATMAYDTVRANTLLFGGGIHDSVSTNATWTWDGTDWTQRHPLHAPEALEDASMVYDRARARSVLFGGTVNGSYRANTWEWDGVDWAMRLTPHAPSARAQAAMAYDPTNQRVVLFAGFPGTQVNDTWEYNGTDWRLHHPPTSPPTSNSAAMAYDESRGNAVLFGVGQTTETWLYTHDVSSEATFTPFGQGCMGTVGMPQLGLADGFPIVGTAFQVACTSLQPDHFTTMWMGFSRTTGFFGSLPYDLGVLGMPGCTLFVGNDIVTALLNWNGTAFCAMQIPNQPQLVGLPFYLQAGVVDHVNALGMVVTNAAALQIGDH